MEKLREDNDNVVKFAEEKKLQELDDLKGALKKPQDLLGGDID